MVLSGQAASWAGGEKMAHSTILGALSQQGWVAINEDSAQRSRTTLQPHSPVPYRPPGGPPRASGSLLAQLLVRG